MVTGFISLPSKSDLGRYKYLFSGGGSIATTTLIPLHANKQSVAQVLGRTTDYVKNPAKTNDGEFILAYECDPLIADTEFQFAQRQYENITGRNQNKNSVIAYHLRQSFKPGEVSQKGKTVIKYILCGMNSAEE